MKSQKEDYPILFADDVFCDVKPELANLLRTLTGSEHPRILIVADMNVVQRIEGLGTKIGRYLQAHGIELAASPVVISGSEKIKADDMHSALRIASAAVSAKIGRNDVMVVIGGGSILDVACWAAAQVRGGVHVVRMPTSVASMIDAAYADYAALDLCCVKDSMRIESIPSAVVVDTGFATTVLDGVWRAGFAEALRIATVFDAEGFNRFAELAKPFNGRDFEAMSDIVRTAVDIRRRNGATTFGLWSALRLESMSNYKVPHGYAVAIGIVIDAFYANLRGLITEAERDRICEVLEDSGAMDCAFHSRHLISSADSVLRGLDAWRLSSGSGSIVLPNGIGKFVIEENPDKDTMKEALNMLK